MNTIKQVRWEIIAGSFITVITCVVVVWSQQLHPSVVEDREAQLSLEISTPRFNYVQLEPVVIDLKLSNQATVPLTWNGLFQIGGENTNLLIRAENGNEVRWKGNSNIDIVMDTEVMQPGMKKEVQNLLPGDFIERRFPYTGRYQLRIEFNYLDFSYNKRKNITVVSNPITIDIVKPKDKDCNAYDYLKQIYYPVFTSGTITEKMRVGQYFLDNFSSNSYEKYIAFDLANRYFETKEYEKAEEVFFQISDVDFYYSKQVEKRLEELARKLNQPIRRTKRPPDYSNAPVARPVPAPIIVPVPLPNNPPVLIVIPNPNPNKTPLR
jgi:hypothetical protein